MTPTILVEKALVSKKGGKVPAVKILGTGTITKKLAIAGCTYSVSAKAAIEAAGGNVQ